MRKWGGGKNGQFLEKIGQNDNFLLKFGTQRKFCRKNFGAKCGPLRDFGKMWGKKLFSNSLNHGDFH